MFKWFQELTSELLKFYNFYLISGTPPTMVPDKLVVRSSGHSSRVVNGIYYHAVGLGFEFRPDHIPKIIET